MSNKYLLADNSRLLKKKLELITTKFLGNLGNETLQTQEAYIFEIIKVLNDFYKSLQEPQLDEDLINMVKVDDLPDVNLYNEIWQQVINDLITIFAELENIENLTVANFNFITTESSRLTTRLKSIDSKLGDYILFSLSPNKDVFFFKDSFNDLSKIDINSRLLNSTECDINQVEGIVTLPINRNQDSLIAIKQLPIINPNSNGVVGNNQELGVPYNGDIAVLLDNNPDTWFEYERVVSKNSDIKEPLILDLTINLGENKVVNHIRINPNNFGTKTIIQIDEIESSIDGQFYTSIKDDIPIAGFTTQDEENVFTLAPSTSKFAGQGLYTFTPRMVKYIRFVLKQNEPYIINTSSGEKLRYAIGIRDINIYGHTYLNKGEMVSLPFSSNREIKKIVLETNQNPTEISELARIQYFISPNDGASWHEIQPKAFSGPVGIHVVPEVINFNTGDLDQVITPVPVNSLRLKVVFTRFDERFIDGSSTFNKRIITTSEMHEVPRASPFSFSLEKPPVNGTVLIIDPLFGSRGISEAQYIIGHAIEGLDIRKYRLPFSLPRPVCKISDGQTPPVYHLELQPASEWIHCEVGGEEWEHADKPLSEYVLDFNNLVDYKKFIFDSSNNTIEFGDGISNTLSPDDNQPIGVYFDAERLYPSANEGNHIAKLDFNTSSNKDDFILKRYDTITSYTQILVRKATVIRLEKQFIQDITDIKRAFLAQGFASEPKTFINGKDELISSDDWSIDTINGIIYTKNPTSAIEDISVTYTYQPITILTTNDWDWGTTNILRDSISINESAWQTIQINDEEMPTTSGIQVLDLSQLSIVKGTLKINVSIDSETPEVEVNPFLKEVKFINGIEELGGQLLQTKESIPNDLEPDINNRISFDLKENISTQSLVYPVVFSNTTLFQTLVGSISAVNGTGKYFIDRVSGSLTYGRVWVYATAIQTSPGTITYFYSSSSFKNSGLYSVDYKYGRIYTQRPINPTDDNTYQILCNYQYTDYRAEYKIARFLDLNSYDVDITNRTITIKDKEILKRMQIPHSTYDGHTPIYLVNYDYVEETRENIESLKDKFTPVLKDYSLRILTKGRIE